MWLIARRLPGESMAEWFARALERLLDCDDAVARVLLEKCVFTSCPI